LHEPLWAKRLGALEDENTWVKLLLAKAVPGNAAVKDALGKKYCRPLLSGKLSLIRSSPLG
jgi:hypothetical protein